MISLKGNLTCYNVLCYIVQPLYVKQILSITGEINGSDFSNRDNGGSYNERNSHIASFISTE